MRIERRYTQVDKATMAEDLRETIYRDLCVKVGGEIVDAGTLAERTRLDKDKVRRPLELRP